MDTILLQDKNYEFGIESGIGMANTPWKQFTVKTKEGSNAEKYVVKIELHHNIQTFDGTPVVYETKAIEVAFHGYSTRENQTVTEYIQTLNEAVAFAERVHAYFKNMGKEIPFINK